jgi:hypothetical protein
MTISQKIKTFIPTTPFVESNELEVKGKVSFASDGFFETEDGGIEYTRAVYAISKKRAKSDVIEFTNKDIAGLIQPIG